VGKVRLLLDFRVEIRLVDKEGNSPLHIGTSAGHTSFVRNLLELGRGLVDNMVEIVNRRNSRGETALHLACTSDRTDIALELCSSGADTSARGAGGAVPLHWARSEEMVRLLLSKGADPLAEDDTGRSPLHAACEAGNAEAAKALCRGGALTFARDHSSRTPLAIACERGDAATVAALLDHYADPNQGSGTHLTPLHIACANGDLQMINLLVSRGARWSCLNRERQTPLEFFLIQRLHQSAAAIASSDDHGDIFCILEDAMLPIWAK
jgi:ankyrin repeat protein